MSSLITILISAGVSLVTALVTFQTRVWGDTMLLRKQHEWEQRKKLTKLVGRYHARLLEAALDWDRRMCQAYAGEYRWLKFDGADFRRSQEQYFYHSMVFRFLNLLIAARSFEREAVFIDARISDDQKELDFLRFVKSFFWATTNSDLTPRDDMPGRDHFANDAFRALLDHCADAGSGTDGERHPFTWTRYWDLVQASVPVPDQRSEEPDVVGGDPTTSLFDQQRSIGVLLDFFWGMAPREPREPGKEPRRRWDRMVCLHLLALGFIASFGYDWQRKAARSSAADAVEQLRPDGVAATAFVDNGGEALGLSRQREYEDIRNKVLDRWREKIETARDAVGIRNHIRDDEVRLSDLPSGADRDSDPRAGVIRAQIAEKERELDELLYGDVAVGGGALADDSSDAALRVSP